MTLSRRTFVRGAIASTVGASLVFRSVPAEASTAITEPTGITRSGNYHLANDITTDAPVGIDILADDVNLDMRGFTVRNTAPAATSVNFGIKCSADSGVKVVNGKLSGWFFGVHGFYCGNALYANLDFTDCTYIGLNTSGNNVSIRACGADGIGGYQAGAYAAGLNLGDGAGIDVADCWFRNIKRQPAAKGVGEGVGVLITSSNPGCVVRRCHIEHDAPTNSTAGIWAGEGGAHLLEGNTVIDSEVAIIGGGDEAGPDRYSGNALWLRRPLAGAVAISADHALAVGNLIVGYGQPGARPFVGDVQARDNEVIP